MAVYLFYLVLNVVWPRGDRRLVWRWGEGRRGDRATPGGAQTSKVRLQPENIQGRRRPGLDWSRVEVGIDFKNKTNQLLS